MGVCAILCIFLILYLRYSQGNFANETKFALAETLCDSDCEEKSELHKCKCMENVTSFHNFTDNNYTETKLNLVLMCKDEYSANFHWKNASATSIFLIELRTENGDWKFANKTLYNYCTIYGLLPQTKYQIRLFEVNLEKNILGPVISEWFETFPEYYTPKEVQAIDVKETNLIHNQRFDVVLEWIPANDISCFYDVVWFMDDTLEHRKITIKDKFEINLRSLDMGKTYNVAVMSGSSDWKRESKKVWHNFTTPTCLETFENLTICEPSMPANLETNETIVREHEGIVYYNVNISWSKPQFLPDYYLVYLIVLQENGSDSFVNVTGEETTAFFEDVELGPHYQIIVYAASSAGTSIPAMLDKQISMQHIIKKHSWHYIVPITILIIILTIAITACIAYKLVHNPQHEIYRRTEQAINSKYFEQRERYNDKYVSSFMNPAVVIDIEDDEWKLDETYLKLDTVLGEGAFGIVRIGTLEKSNNNVSVAVKMLKGNPSSEEITQFKQEMEIMKSVGRHPHLVSLEGCSSSSTYGPLLIVEYCDNGDLQSFLRKFWENLSDSPYINVAQFHNASKDNFSNLLYQYEDEPVIKPGQLLSFARQIALGMEYLSSLRVIHRDLATRNVLVCKDGTVKVADFGLSRDVYQDNVYLKTGTGKVPVKWMALESLSHAQYTTQSDVWSFGIVLWEIVTLGGDPYPGIPTHDLLRRLNNGYRLEQPSTCSDELYKVMESCWNAVALERPTFSELRNLLEKMMEDKNNYIRI